MFEQQLQIAPEQLQRESRVDWNNLKRLYYQTLKSQHPPQPHTITAKHQPSLTSTEIVFTKLLQEIAVENSKQMLMLQDIVSSELAELRNRISRLEELLLYSLQNKLLSPSLQPNQESFKTPSGKEVKQMSELESTKIKPSISKSLIYIEEDSDNEVSLLDEEVAGPILQGTELSKGDSVKRTQPSLPMRTVVNSSSDGRTIRQGIDCSFLNNCQSNRNMLTDKVYSINCVFHEKLLKDLKEEVEAMKNFMKETYGIQIQYSDWLNRVKSNDEKDESEREGRRPMMYSSEHSQQHLLNENDVLRTIILKYKQMLVRAGKQVKVVKSLLKQSIKGSR